MANRIWTGLANAAGALACTTLFLCPGVAAAWGPVGHRAVGAVADSLLNARARAAVADLLQQDLDRNARLSGRSSLAEVANWADEIRGGTGDHPHWHYDNRPICGGIAHPAAGGSSSGKGAAWCPDGECATAKLTEMIAVVADSRRSRAERNEALKWVVHLVGDVHQPLHEADLAEGGNRIHIIQQEHPGHHDEPSDFGGRDARPRGSTHAGHEGNHSLHAYWDNHLVALALHADGDAVPMRAIERLTEEASALSASLVAAPPEIWAQESNGLARTVALDLPGVGCTSGADARQPTLTHVSAQYKRKGVKIVEQRLALAGARLAKVLNDTLGAGR